MHLLGIDFVKAVKLLSSGAGVAGKRRPVQLQ